MRPIHLPFWIVLFIGLFVAAAFGLVLGAPTLRLRGDYLAIVTLGFGEIVPRVFKNLSVWTSGVNGISALDKPVLPVWLHGPWSGDPLEVVQNFKIISPMAFYVVMVLLLGICVVLVNNLRKSRVGRAWMAVREDEVAAAAMGVNTVRIKLLAFSIGAAFSGFAGSFYGAKLSLVSPENFGFTVSITILVMIVLGGMGNIPGVIIGSLLIYWITFLFLPALPPLAEDWATIARPRLARAAERRLARHRPGGPAAQVPALRDHPRAHDAAAAAGPHPEPGPPAGAHQGRARGPDHRGRERGDDGMTVARPRPRRRRHRRTSS